MQGWGRDGIALISGLIFLAITVVLVSIALLVSTSNRRLSADYLRSTEAQLAADAGLERAVYETWFKPHLENDNVHFELSLQAFRAGLDEAGILAGPSVSATRFGFGMPVSFEDTFENASYLTTLRRVDVGNAYTLLRLDSTGWVGDTVTRRVTEDFKIAIPQHDASQFALLSNQANCVFCHTQMTSLEVAYSPEGNLKALEGLTPQERSITFKNKSRVRVGVLERLLSDRVTDMKSLITGTLYSRGETNIFASNSTLYGVPFNKIDGHTTSRLSADEARVLSSAANCAFGCNQRLEVAYRNYPFQGPDGELPKVFPSLIKDDNQNRLIEHSEWRATVQQSESGYLKGGSKKRVDTTASDTLTLNADRATGLRNTSATLSSAESIDGVAGHLLLEGSSSSPLVLTGDLYVNGDVMIRGPVTGDGKIVARGNVYIVGDLTYVCDDDSRDFSWSASNQVSCNYGLPDTLPRLGLVAGKNILLGNYMMPNLSAASAPEDQLTRQSFASASAEDLSQWFIDAGQALAPAALSYTMIQAALFNQQEYDQARKDSSYIPRFYRMREDSPVWLCASGLSSKADYCKHYADLTNLSLSTRSEDMAILEKASLVSVTPTGNWLTPEGSPAPEQESELFVRRVWVEAVETRSAQEALRIDGVIFSGNGMFGMLPADSKTSGKALVNGSLIIADYAFLPTQGLRLHYDARLGELIDPSVKTTVVQTRSNYRLLKANEQVSYQDMGY